MIMEDDVALDVFFDVLVELEFFDTAVLRTFERRSLHERRILACGLIAALPPAQLFILYDRCGKIARLCEAAQ